VYAQTVIIGNVGADPEKKSVNGHKLCTFTVATAYRYKTSDGERKEVTTWYRVSAWGNLAQIVADYVRKGRQVHVTGRMICNEKEVDGVKRKFWELRANELTLLGKKSDSSGGGDAWKEGEKKEKPREQKDAWGDAPAPYDPNDFGPPPGDDDIPF